MHTHQHQADHWIVREWIIRVNWTTGVPSWTFQSTAVSDSTKFGKFGPFFDRQACYNWPLGRLQWNLMVIIIQFIHILWQFLWWTGHCTTWNIEKMTKSISPERPYIELLPNWENHLTALEHPENFFYALKKKFNYILTRLNENILHSIHIRPVKNIWKMK